MNIELLKTEQIEYIYNNQMQEDFPAEELKPLAVIRSLCEDGLYFAYGLFEKNQLLGYAFFCKDIKNKYALLDYYAIDKNHRNEGLGKYFLNELRHALHAEYAALLIESEAVTANDSAEQQEKCRHRLKFYKRNGCLELDANVILHSIVLNVLVMPCGGYCDRHHAFHALQRIYARMLPDDKDIILTLN